MALTAGYEAVREASRRYEAKQAARLEGLPSKLRFIPLLERVACSVMCSALMLAEDDSSERSSLLLPGSSAAAQERTAKTVKAALYGVQVFYSFFIM